MCQVKTPSRTSTVIRMRRGQDNRGNDSQRFKKNFDLYSLGVIGRAGALDDRGQGYQIARDARVTSHR